PSKKTRAKKPLLTQEEKATPGTVDPGQNLDLATDEQGAVPIMQVAKSAANVVRDIAKVAERTIVSVTGPMSYWLEKTPTGHTLVAALDRSETQTELLKGRIENELHDAWKALTHEDNKWFGLINPDTGISNLRMALDKDQIALPADNPRLAAFKAVWEKMMEITADEAERVEIMQERGGGLFSSEREAREFFDTNVKPNHPKAQRKITPKVGKEGEYEGQWELTYKVPFQRAQSGRLIRTTVPDASRALMRESGPFYEAIVAAIVQRNPGFTEQEAKETLSQWRGPNSIKKVGAIEAVRKIPVVPDYVWFDGAWTPFMETDPLILLRGALDSMARRIYFVENVSQDEEVVAKMRKAHVTEGGKADDFDNIIGVYFGRPFSMVFGLTKGRERNIATRAARTISSLISTNQTGQSAIPNAFQPLLVARYTGFVKLAKAYYQALSHPSLTASQMASLGANRRSIMDWSIRKGNIPEDIAKIVRGVSGRITGLHWIVELNNLVAGDCFRQLADQWRMHGMEVGDVRVGKELRLTPAELADAKVGQISDETYAKIVQTGVKITQYATESRHRKSALQNDPFFSAVFAYNNYAIGAAQSSYRMAEDVKEALVSGDARVARATAARLTSLLIASAGAGVAGVLLRRAIKGQPILEPDEKWYDLLWRGLWEVQLLGPAQRMIDSNSYDRNDMARWFIGMMPQVGAVLDMLGAVVGKGGPWAQFPVEKRVGEVMLRNAPVAKSVDTWLENIAYPDLPQYYQVRKRVFEFQKAQPEYEEKGGGGFPKNRHYYLMQQAFIRLDSEEVEKLAKTFLDGFKEGNDRKEATANLRKALATQRPINMSVENGTAFLADLYKKSPKDAAEALALQERYNAIMDKVAPSQSRTGPQPPRPKKQERPAGSKPKMGLPR
ncbi:MAG: hypothetical protein IMZ62_02680, partial [Chloroflexi bacterium]|nr:hypothetical protein [Chloroflexota bacterium]